jgi:hypothetical protein
LTVSHSLNAIKSLSRHPNAGPMKGFPGCDLLMQQTGWQQLLQPLGHFPSSHAPQDSEMETS